MARLEAHMYPALSDEAIRRLRSANVNTVFDFVGHDDGKLMKLIDFSFKNVKEFKEQIIENFSGKIKNARELLRREEENVLSTGIPSLDDLLEGGLHPGEIYELCGCSSAGKTQICQSLAVNVVLKTDGVVHYVDTKRDFTAGRIQSMLEAQKHSDEEAAKVMDQILVTRVSKVHELLSFLHLQTKSSEAKGKPVKLLIIDSLSSLILASAKNCKSFYLLNHIANFCKFISSELGIAVVNVNLVSEWREAEGFRGIETEPVVVKPTLGKFWLDVPSTRLLVEKLESEDRRLSVWKSFRLRVGASCILGLSNSGVGERES